MAVDRVYIPDDVSVALTGGTLQGVVAGDDVTAAMPASGTLADANAGQARPVSVPAIVLSGANASNYTLNQPEGLTANIARAGLGSAEVTLSQTVFLYDGAQKRPGVQQVTLNGCTLTAGQDYVIEGYEGGQAIGDAAVIVTGLGNYQNSARAAYRVVSISEVDIRIEPEAQSFVYDLTAHEPAIVVSLGGEPLDESAYTVVYRDNIYPGTGTVSVLSDAESAGAAAVFRFPIADRGWTAPTKPSDGAGWAVPPEATSALESEALAGTAFAAVDLSGTRCASIGEMAFSGMDGLEAVLMPASLASMAPDAFDGVERGQVTLCFPDGVNPNLSIGDEGSGTSTALDRLKAWAFERGVFLELDSYENP